MGIGKLKRRNPTPPGYGARRAAAEARQPPSRALEILDEDDDDDDGPLSTYSRGAAGCLLFLLALLALAIWVDW